MKRVAIFILALVLAGCASTGGLAPASSVADPNALAAAHSLADARLSPAAWPSTDWWKSLGDPQLDQLVDETLRGSPTLRIARARSEKALALAQGADAARYPRIDAAASITRQRIPFEQVAPPPLGGSWITLPEAKATLSWDVDAWGRNRAAYESAVGQARAAEVDAFAARLALSVNVAQAYVQLHRAYLQLDVARKTLAERQSLYDLTRQLFDAGIDTQLAVKQAEAALPATRTQIAQLH